MANNYTGSSSTMAYIERMKKLGALQAALAEAKTTAEKQTIEREIAKETQKNKQSTGSPFVDHGSVLEFRTRK